MSTTPADAAVIEAPPRSWPLRELIILALIAALVVVSKMVLRMPLKIPAHNWFVVIALLVVGRGLIRRPGVGTAMALVAGVLATFLVPSEEGPLLWLKYAAAGAALDLMAWVIRERWENLAYAGLAGGVALSAKLVTDLAVAVALRLPTALIVAGLGISAIAHVAFGVGGGVAGAFVIQRLERTGLPAFRRLRKGTSG